MAFGLMVIAITFYSDNPSSNSSKILHIIIAQSALT